MTRPRYASRGITLLEVLLATALLAMLAIVVVGFVRDIGSALPRETTAVARHEVNSEHAPHDPSAATFAALSTTVDDRLSNDQHLHANLAARSAFEPIDLKTDLGHVRVSRIDPTESEADHAWAVFEQDGTRVIRFVRLVAAPLTRRERAR